MPIIIPNELPAAQTLQRENIFTMSEGRAGTQDIRPLEILIVNLMYEYLLQKAQEISDSDLRTLCVQRFEENREKLLYYPAASKNHGAEMAGLLWHESLGSQ